MSPDQVEKWAVFSPLGGLRSSPWGMSPDQVDKLAVFSPLGGLRGSPWDMSPDQVEKWAPEVEGRSQKFAMKNES